MGAIELNPTAWKLVVVLGRVGRASHHHLTALFNLLGEMGIPWVLLGHNHLTPVVVPTARGCGGDLTAAPLHTPLPPGPTAANVARAVKAPQPGTS